MRPLLIVLVAATLGAPPVLAQTADDGGQSDEANRSPSTVTRPEPPAPASTSPHGSRLAAGAEWIQSVFTRDKVVNGFYPEWGGLPPGSGVSIGPGYRHRIFDGHASIDASAAVAWTRGTFAQASFELPALADNKVTVGTQAKRQDFTRVSFYGVGPGSGESDGTEYRLQNSDYLVYATVKPGARTTASIRLGYSPPVAIERPRVADLPPTADLFAPAAAPALTDRPAFLHGDASVGVDTRNHPARPTSGGDYWVGFTAFSDRTYHTYSFQRLEAEASQYIPILHENWVIALRARVAASNTSAGNVVPFYLLPAIGGGHSLRSFDDYRFMDRHAFVANAEYRWRVFGALDGALFYDAGNVAPRFHELDFKSLKTSYGIGFRFHSDDTTFFRIDVARGSEGTRVLLSINDSLRPGHGSILIPYVP